MLFFWIDSTIITQTETVQMCNETSFQKHRLNKISMEKEIISTEKDIF